LEAAGEEALLSGVIQLAPLAGDNSRYTIPDADVARREECFPRL
jgi:hypothetical protein